MATTNFNLDIDDPYGKRFWFRAHVATGTAGLIRLNIAVHEFDSDNPENSQGMDLSPEECRALAQMLEAAAAMRELEDAKLQVRDETLE